ncbi:MAG: hypothetical protein WA110_04840 [Anaerolineaceae bacterium]
MSAFCVFLGFFVLRNLNENPLITIWQQPEYQDLRERLQALISRRVYPAMVASWLIQILKIALEITIPHVGAAFGPGVYPMPMIYPAINEIV